MKAEAGRTATYSTDSEISISFGGETVKLNSKDKSSVRVVKVLEDGSIEFETTTLESTLTIDGEEMDDEGEEPDSKILSTFRPNGVLTRYADADPEADPATTQIGARVTQASSVKFSGQEVSAGSSWTVDVPAIADLKVPAGRGTYRLLAFEAVNGIATAKIEFSYAESGSAANATFQGTSWVELASGDTVRGTSSFAGLPFDFGTGEAVKADGKESSDRLSGGLLASAQSSPSAPAQPATTEPNTKPAEEKKPEEDRNSIDFKMKDWEKKEGLFTLYTKKEATRTRYNLEIKRSQLDTLFFMQATISRGDSSRAVAGDPLSDTLFEFREVPGDKIFMIVPQTGYRSPGSAAIQRVLDRSFSDSAIEAFDIEARQKDRDSVLIDISTFFTGNLIGINELLSGAGGIASLLGGGEGGVSPDREKTYLQRLSVFPTNVYAETVYSFSGRGGGAGNFEEVFGGVAGSTPDRRNVNITVAYNLYPLPAENGYVPRRFDPRIGYFNVTHQDISDIESRRSVVQNIARWHLVKKEPFAPMSEPVEPIVFWV
ncbi:MAG: DUF5117 domain-containing protein, partial [Fimbriimonadaceae bacterium]|nr:DUF5117 domain-containing protein [Fimbriimonadaceae bacterium]